MNRMYRSAGTRADDAPVPASRGCRMPTLYETLPLEQQLELAVRTRSPAQLAQAFAAFAGQFYDRSAFDDLARRASDLYADEGAERASEFRARLDRRLCDRYREPVAWDVGSTADQGAA